MAEVPIYRRQQIEVLATEFLAQHNTKDSFPIPIEVMLGRLKIDVYPVPRFRDAYGNQTAALNNDVSSITIDEALATGAYNFALAHEGGHYRLHGPFIKSLAIADGDPLQTWRQHLKANNPLSLSDLERQADIFARIVLMPDSHFGPELRRMESVLPPGIDWFTATDAFFLKICDVLADKFKTSIGSVVRRLADYGITRD